MREWKPPFEKKFQVKLVITFNEIIFPEKLPYANKYTWGISYEYLSGWPEVTEEEITRLCSGRTICINS